MNLSHLNPPQREAVLHGAGPLLVLAGAGSGKTRVITYRVAQLLANGIPPRSVLGVTFTNRAAAEMRERIGSLVGKAEADALTLSTFHALGLQILKAERKALGFPSGFTVYDTSDQLGVLRECLREVKAADRRFDVKAILARISKAKNAMEAEPGGTDDDDYDEITRVIFPRYQRALRAFAAVDFDDLIGEPVRLLENDPAVAERWCSRFRWLLVDEYQDTNTAQLRLIRGLARDHDNVMVVGDDDQSIYAWRGADARNILGFESFFAGAKVVKLKQNYRSTPTILAAANAIIRNNAQRRDKTLWSDGKQGAPIMCLACADAETEARFVADEIVKLHDTGRRWKEMAVLYRSNLQARPLEEMLRERRIPYDLVGGQKFFDRKEVKDVVAYLKLCLNPRDEIALRRIINYPARGIGPVTVEKALLAAQAAHIPLYEALRTLDHPKAPEFFSLIEALRGAVDEGRPGHAVDILVERTQLYADLRDAGPTPQAADRRVSAVEDLKRSLVAYTERKPGSKALRDYLHLMTLTNRDDEDEVDGGEKVTLSTIHGAKGLEWPVVFLVGLEEELLPHSRTLNPTATDIQGGTDISEERRLAYVAITRAREQLYVSRARTRALRGKPMPRTPSRFLQEIPPDLMAHRDLEAEDRAPVAAEDAAAFFKNFSLGSR